MTNPAARHRDGPLIVTVACGGPFGGRSLSRVWCAATGRIYGPAPVATSAAEDKDPRARREHAQADGSGVPWIATTSLG